MTDGSAVRLDMVILGNYIAGGVPARIIKENITDEDRRVRMGPLLAD